MRLLIAGKRTLLAATAAAVLLVVAVSGWPLAGERVEASHGVERERAAPDREAACPGAELAVDAADASQVRRALACRLNLARERRDRPRLDRDGRLRRAAQKHARTMVATDCLDFDCPGEPDLAGRLEKAGYLEDARRWAFAENTGCAASARSMFETWAASTFHRENMLEPRFVHVGIGIAEPGPPSRCQEGFAAFSAVFGWRTP